jgi:hypothetical protein
MEDLGAWGTLIHEKNLKSKISCQTPFKFIFLLVLVPCLLTGGKISKFQGGKRGFGNRNDIWFT